MFAYQKCIPLYKDGMTDILCNHKFYFYVLMFANEFQMKVTLCNNNVRRSLLGDWSMQAKVSDLYRHIIVGFLQDAKAFLLFRVCVVIIKTNWYRKKQNNLLYSSI